MSAPTQLQVVIGSLFYPAFLGNMSYVAAEKLFKTPGFFDLTTSLIVLALIFHYVMDWTYTIVLKKEQPYTPLKFLADSVIVVCLYVAMRLALAEEGVLFKEGWSWLSQPVFWLLITKFSAVVWELAEVTTLNPKKWTCLKKLEVGVDLGFVFLYLALGLEILGAYSLTIYFALAVLCDASFYAFHKMIQHKCSTSTA
ncbi:MAG: hypothetical protein ACR65W_17925 [Methylocystis sp.]|uniref:hypothetical protein n=1 Tax=Methylocystis sp. TaxID=1911079 RepID=UPI003DA29076